MSLRDLWFLCIGLGAGGNLALAVQLLLAMRDDRLKGGTAMQVSLTDAEREELSRKVADKNKQSTQGSGK